MKELYEGEDFENMNMFYKYNKYSEFTQKVQINI